MVLPKEVPVMTISNATLFPQALLPLHIFEPRYRQMLADTLRTNRMFSVAMQKPGRSRETPCLVAGLGLIRVSVDHRDGTSHLILQGLSRIQLGPPKRYKPYRVHPMQVLESSPPSALRVEALIAKVHELVEQRIKMGAFPLPFPLLEEGEAAKSNWNKAASKFTVNEIMNYLKGLPDADQVADLVSCALLPRAAERQAILETVQIEERLQQLIDFLMAEIRRTRKDHTK